LHGVPLQVDGRVQHVGQRAEAHAASGAEQPERALVDLRGVARVDEHPRSAAGAQLLEQVEGQPIEPPRCRLGSSAAVASSGHEQLVGEMAVEKDGHAAGAQQRHRRWHRIDEGHVASRLGQQYPHGAVQSANGCTDDMQPTAEVAWHAGSRDVHGQCAVAGLLEAPRQVMVRRGY
jgi:hypothetical protein